MRRLMGAVALLLALGSACGDGSDLDQKLEAWCQRCNFYADMAQCMQVQRAILGCTNCPAEFAEQTQCLADNDCTPGPDVCDLPSGCRVGSITRGLCPP